LTFDQFYWYHYQKRWWKVLEYLFGNPTIEKVLFFLEKNGDCYPSQLRNAFEMPLYSFQKALGRLERGSVIVSHRKGKTLIYQFNPRYPFLKELKALLQKAYEFFPEEMRKKFYEPIVRKRPRRQGKPL
jgi:hypothetical protein